jgi:hypothetical protein
MGTAAVQSPAEMPNISNLVECIEDSRLAALDGDAGPADPTNYSQLVGRLEASREKLPPLYRDAVFEPFTNTLRGLGPTGFVEVLMRDPSREGMAGLMLDIAHTVLQNGEGYAERATDGFEEVVSDLYDGFLSAEDRRGIKPPDLGTIAPLVKWGNPDFGPYTWPGDATKIFGVKCAVVNLPPANGRRGLLAWAALAHETAGHDLLHADKGLEAEVADRVEAALLQAKFPADMAEYWASRIDETASDVLGILNMGPAAGIGLIGYFRALNAAFTHVSKLRNSGSRQDPHPADILRGFLAASTVRRLKFRGAGAWADVIEEETHKDVSTIVLEGNAVTEEDARRSADVVAKTIMQEKMKNLENHSFCSIQNWRNSDDVIISQLRQILTTATPLPSSFAEGIYAAHAVAAGAIAALAGEGSTTQIFERMLTVLKTMHDGNPSWGPLFVVHPGNIRADRAYIPEMAASA